MSGWVHALFVVASAAVVGCGGVRGSLSVKGKGGQVRVSVEEGKPVEVEAAVDVGQLLDEKGGE